ncbi:hypothetical protein Tcan_16304 [Toxocara canis]|uniref:G protein-coupled receptor n=1 Tax=Toxocara canis TaxID=6265 RepID=A0A0B2W1L3_TOXCA|nr:hypothetical protein Tcan_16304 [Toxocara canis]
MGDDDLNEHYLYSKAPLWSIYTQLSFDVVMLFAAPTLLVAVVIRKIFHRNLIALLVNLQAAYIIYALTRLYLIFTALRIATLSHSIYAFTWKLNNFSLYTASLNMAALVTERVSAVMFARFYEKFCDRIPLYGICLAIVQWGISSIIISLYTDGALSRFTVIAIWFCCHLFASMIFIVLPRITTRMYERKLREPQNAPSHRLLSEQYQLSENVRTATLLRPIILLVGVTSCIAPTSFFVLSFSPNHQSALFMTSMHLQLPIEAIALTAVMFARCPQLRMGMAVSLRCRNAVAPSSYPPRSLNGKTLVVPLEEEGTIYFGALAKAWA